MMNKLTTVASHLFRSMKMTGTLIVIMAMQKNKPTTMLRWAKSNSSSSGHMGGSRLDKNSLDVKFISYLKCFCI